MGYPSHLHDAFDKLDSELTDVACGVIALQDLTRASLPKDDTIEHARKVDAIEWICNRLLTQLKSMATYAEEQAYALRHGHKAT